MLWYNSVGLGLVLLAYGCTGRTGFDSLFRVDREMEETHGDGVFTTNGDGTSWVDR